MSPVARIVLGALLVLCLAALAGGFLGGCAIVDCSIRRDINRCNFN